MDDFRNEISEFDEFQGFHVNENGEITIQPKKLKAARNVKEIEDSFEATPLTTPEDMKDFYVETMEARTGDLDESPIIDMEIACRSPRDHNAMLIMGHRGCGKSTELNDMKLRLEAEGRPVRIIQCEERLPLENKPRFSDLLILMGETLYQMARELDVPIASGTLETIQNFWNPTVRVMEKVKEEEINVGAGVEVGPPGLLKTVTNLFMKLNSDLKFNDTVRETSEKCMENYYADWRKILRQLSDGIWRKVRKQPILIFEGLDHLENLDEARDLFFSHAGKLTDVSFPVIYTFPIALYYDKGFGTFEHLFHLVTVFPMLKLETLDGKPYPEGADRLREIVNRRVKAGVIEPDALELMIAKSGGSLRDLFFAIRTAADRAYSRKRRTKNDNETVKAADAERALIKLKSNLSRRIEGEEHKFLAEICAGKRQEIEKSQTLLDMLQARAVLEYNGERWFNVHPLVTDYLEELGYIRRKEDGAGWEKTAKAEKTNETEKAVNAT